MRLVDTVKLSLQSFANRRSRIVLTMLGVAVGIAVIMFLVSLGYGLQKTILDRITTAEALLTLDVTAPDNDSLRLTDTVVAQLSDREHVNAVSPRRTLPARMRAENLNSETTLHIVDRQYFELAGLSAGTGSVFDDASDTNGVVITSTVAQLFGLTADTAMDQPITFTVQATPATEDATAQQYTYTVPVTGVLSDDVSENIAFLHHTTVADLPTAPYALVKVQVDDQKNLSLVQESLTDDGFTVSALSDLVEQAGQVFTILQVILAAFGIFSLLVASIGLLNTMTISLLERTNEIGIMRALGATKRDIRTLFLIESSLIGLIGGIVGLIAGGIGGLLFNVVLNIVTRSLGGQAISIFATPFWFIVLVLGLSIVVGFLSGFFPARRASNLNTLEALRYK